MREILGRKLKRDIVSPNGLTIIPAETILTEQHLHLIANHKADRQSIFLYPDKMEQRKNQVNEIVKQSEELFHSIKYTSEIPVKDLTTKLVPQLREFVNNTNVYELLETLKYQDDYTYRHNIAVGAIATLIGNWLKLDEDELSSLTLAGTMHDVGKLNIPSEILNKPGKLTVEEFDLIKSHTIIGYDLLKESFGQNSNVSLVALQHHEKGNGKGYPYGIRKNKIHYHSKIVMVADVYHAMSSKRSYHEVMPFYEVINHMRASAYGEMDPKILSVFHTNMIRRLIGQQVELLDGTMCKVVYVYPYEQDAIFQLENGTFLDSSKDHQIHIKEVFI
ncbi:HD-GYP domain-containing protein [Paenibacillus tianjinensis]|uniref:HD-GYP domain-containing protein n=1 Tax=Paenibacillus tianjinensis TaxID=2810347 RepID=A0ABX7LBZ1_9BACL|nr:HD-GYP domain-containing protein [Paenibacillus tianjinensis]QSF45665.1 HD-GYP domain-containing protein [Paenibacillus tianjinensis]